MMKENKNNEKNKINISKEAKVMVLVLALIMVVFVGSSFAWYNVTASSNNSVTLDVGSLDVTIDSTSDLSLSDVLPESKEDALKADGFKFTVNNKGTIPVNYTVSLKDGTYDSTETKLDDKYAACVLYKGTESVQDGYVSNFTNGVMYNTDLAEGKSDTYELKCYLDESVFDSNAAGKTFKKVVNVKAVQKDS